MTTTRRDGQQSAGGRSSDEATSRAPRRRGVRVLGVLLVLAFVGGWLYLIYGSPVFAARDVEVTGNAKLSDREITAAAAVPLGTPLARVDLAALEAKVLRLPRVQTVAVERSWPNTVRVRVTERVPVATVSRNGTWWVVDDEAVVVETARKRPKLPVLDVASPSPKDAATRSALTVLERLPEKLADRTRKVSAETPDSVQLHLPKSVTVVWGNASQSAHKARVLSALRQAQPKGRTYDVSTPDTPTVTKR